MVRYVFIVLATIFGLIFFMNYNITNAGILGDLGTIISGHIDDVKNRFKDDQVLVAVKVLKTGDIDVDAVGQDFAHNASGTITLVEKNGKRYVQLGTNFKSSPGPDYHVYVSIKTDIKEEKDFSHSEQVELGKLIKGSGATFYEVPNGINVNSVTIWCKAFSAYIGSANIK